MPELGSFLPRLWFGLLHYLPLAVYVAMSWALGRRLTRSLSYRGELEAAVLSVSLGLGVFGSAFFALAVAGLFTTPWIIALLVISQMVSYRSWRGVSRHLRRWWAGRDARWRAVAVVGLGVVLLPLLILPLYPPTAFDALLYHLPMARAIVEQQGIEFFPELRYPAFPALQQTQYAAGLLLTTDLTPALLHTAALFGVALLAYCWGSWISSRRAGLLAALLWIGTLEAVVTGSSPYVDCSLALFVTAAIFCFHRYARQRELGWLLASAAFLSFAAGTKYQALFFLGALSLATLFVTIRRRRPLHLLWYGVVLAALTLPWYVFIYVQSGSPVHPFYPQVFGQDDWSYTLNRELRRAPSSPTKDEESPRPFLRAVGQRAQQLVTEDTVDALRMSVGVFLHPKRYRGRSLSPYYLVALPFMVLMAFRFQRGRWATLLTATYFLFLSSTVFDMRYALPILPVIAVFGAEGADRLFDWLTPSSQRWIAVPVTLALAFPLGYHAHRLGQQQWNVRGSLPIDQTAKDRYIQRRVNQYRAVQELDRVEDGDYRLYGLFTENLRYYVGGTLLGDWFGPGRYHKVMRHLRDPAELHTVLRTLDVEYFLVPNLRRWKGGRLARWRVARIEQMRTHFRVIYRSELSVIYKLRRHPRSVDPTTSALTDVVRPSGGDPVVDPGGQPADGSTDDGRPQEADDRSSPGDGISREEVPQQ